MDLDGFSAGAFGRYRILGLVGEGGMSVVYRALDPTLDREVAIKVLKVSPMGKASTNPAAQAFLSRFEREAHALARLQHPNIVPVIDYGSAEEKYPYLVMPLLSGGTLESKIDQAMPVREASRLVAPVAEALAYAHHNGIIHRDIKPTNILLTESGDPMLADFGIARFIQKESQSLTTTGAFIGTPGYMAPEQWNGETVPQTDIFSLGLVYYQLLTGHNPYTADTPQQVMYKQLMGSLPSPRDYVPDLPAKVEEALLCALAREPKERYASMDIFAELLRQFASGSMGGGAASARPSAPTILDSPGRAGQPSVPTTGQTAVEAMPAMPGMTQIEAAPAREHTYAGLPPAEAVGRTGWKDAASTSWFARFPGCLLTLAGVAFVLLIAGFVAFRALGKPDGFAIIPVAASPTSTSAPATATPPFPTITQPAVTATPPAPTADRAAAPTPTQAPAVLLPTLAPTDIPSPTAPPAPTAVPIKTKVLWDCSHKPVQSTQDKDANGDFLRYDLAGLYSQMAQLLTEEGLTVDCSQQNLASVDLSSYGVIVLSEWSASQPYSSSDAAVIEQFVNQGGGLLILADNPNTNKNVGAVAKRFGVTVGNPPIIGGEINGFTGHPITQSVASIKFYFDGGTLGVSNPDEVVASAGSHPAVVAIDSLPGRVVVVGDANLFDNRGFEYQDNKLFALNVFHWLYRQN